MQFGKHLHELTRQRLGFALSILLAALVALSSGYRIGLSPPSLHARSISIATASTQVLVDTPHTAVLDMRQNTNDFKGMSNRAVLIGNVMASLPVRDFIAARAHIAPQVIKAATPLTPAYPRPISGTGNEKKTSDLLKSTDEYRLNIQANPTVPMLEIYAQAPTAQAAAELANAAVDGMHDYLAQVAKSQGVGRQQQVRLQQLGRARGHVINGGARLQLVVLVFFFTFGLCAAAVLFIGRVRRGWKVAAEREEPALVPQMTEQM
jgi:hypothetical protein